jgi:hypothetical protein
MNRPQLLPTALAFYSADGTGTTQWAKAAAKQSFRQSYCRIDPAEIAIDARFDRLLPWVVPYAAAIASVLLVEKDAIDYATINPKGYADITDLLTTGTFTFDGTDFVEMAGSSDINQATTIGANSVSIPAGFSTTWAAWVRPGGLYYLVLVFADSKRFYSELIRISDFPEFSEIPDSCESRVRIEASNNCDIGGIPPVIFAPQKLFVDQPLSKPTYTLDKEPAADGQDEETVVWAKVKKRWRLSFFAIESVADFCSLLPIYAMSGVGVNITDMYGVQGPASDVETEVSWPDDTQDCLALITITFTREYVSSTNCC